MRKEIELTAVLFIRHVTAIIVSVTDPTCWDAATCVVTLELVVTTCCTVTLNTFVHLSTLYYVCFNLIYSTIQYNI